MSRPGPCRKQLRRRDSHVHTEFVLTISMTAAAFAAIASTLPRATSASLAPMAKRLLS